MAEREGFEPSEVFSPRSFSKALPSAAQPSFQIGGGEGIRTPVFTISSKRYYMLR